MKAAKSQVESGLIHIGGILSFRAFQRFAEDRGYDEWFRPWIEPQWLGWFIALLKECDEDNVSLFPHGKWATIQVMQDYLAEAARAELPLGYSKEGFREVNYGQL